MNIFHLIILGVVEGLTEFLPISSTFHLLITSDLLNLVQTPQLKLFEVVIQPGAILAVLGLFGRELFSDKKLMKSLLISFIPTMLIGFFFAQNDQRGFFRSENG